MPTSQRFPPSARDFEVYEFVELEGATTREAASRFGLSQTRICQILERVSLWQAEVVPRRAEQLDEQDLLVLGKCMAGRRLQTVYGQALQAWRRSYQDQSLTFRRKPDEEIGTQTAKLGFGQASFLHVAIRAAVQLGKLSVLPGLIEGLEATAIEEAVGEPAASTIEVQTVERCDSLASNAALAPEGGATCEGGAPEGMVPGDPSPFRACSTFCTEEDDSVASDVVDSKATTSALPDCDNDLVSEARESARANGAVQTTEDGPETFLDVGAARDCSPAMADGPAAIASGQREVVVNLDADPSEAPRLRVRQVGADEEDVPIVVVELDSQKPDVSVRFEQSKPGPADRAEAELPSRPPLTKKRKASQVKKGSRVEELPLKHPLNPRSA